MLNPKLIVAVKSCFDTLSSHDQVREMWARTFRGKSELKFFLGRPTSEIAGTPKSLHPTWQNSYIPKSDEVILDCPDDYNSSVWKTRGICKWSTDRLISHLLMVDAFEELTYFEKADYRVVDYMGYFNGDIGVPSSREIRDINDEKIQVNECYPWPRKAFFLSKAAATIIAETVPKQAVYIHGSYDDYWVGQILGPMIESGELLAEDMIYED